MTNERQRFYAYAFPANNGDLVGMNEMDILGYPFLRSTYAVNLVSGMDWDRFTDLTFRSRPVSKEIRCGWRADRLFFLGMTPACDTGTGGWYVATGDTTREFFIGDSIGSIRIVYAGGDAVEIPLTIGFTAWWFNPWEPALLPFAQPGPARSALDASLYLHDIYDKRHGGYFLAFQPRRGAVIEQITISNNPDKLGWPTLLGLTVENPSSTGRLIPFIHPYSAPQPVTALTEEVLARPQQIASRIERLQRSVYTFGDSLPSTVPLDIPEDFSGPQIRFSGSACAQMLTNEYHHCLGASIENGSALKCRDNGGYQGLGCWTTDGVPGGTAWTRDVGRLLIERIEAGWLAGARESIAELDRMLYGWRDFTPLPLPHWVQSYQYEPQRDPVTGQCHFARSKVTNEVVVGNIENDGHGLLMLARYRFWVRSGRDRQWLTENWQATHDAAEWICWQLDNPLDVAALAVDHPSHWNQGFRNTQRQHFPDCLWSEQESTYYGGCDIWGNFACYAGLLASIRMAQAEGNTKCAERWSSYSERLQKGMLAHLTVEAPGFGKTWNFIPFNLWRDYNESLAPLIEGADVLGFDVSELGAPILAISRATYQARIRRGAGGSKRYEFARSFGYGQSFITEAALLLDEMEDATRLIENTAQFIYSPFYRSWICSEGCAVHPTGKYWYRTGGMGNEVQIASVVRTIRMLAGIDDYNPPLLRIIPRLPLGWHGITADEVPTAISHAQIRIVYERPSELAYALTLSSDRNIPAVEIRFGPFPADVQTQQVLLECNVTGLGTQLIRSGDSSWVWVRGCRDVSEIRACVRIGA